MRTGVAAIAFATGKDGARWVAHLSAPFSGIPLCVLHVHVGRKLRLGLRRR